MKLGIIVVYLLDQEDAGLLDLHLRQIERCTKDSYTIYAAANRLATQLRARLETDSRIKVIKCPHTEKRNAEEHSYYLEQLAHAAADDGATHIVSLHADSFPIRPGWAETLANQMTPSQPLGAMEYGPYTACLFFRRDFYLNQQPHFLLSKAQSASAEYKDFSLRHKHIRHSGIGYLFRAYTAGLHWYSLAESTTGLAHGAVYAHSVFHLHGHPRLKANPSPSDRSASLRIGSILQTGHALARKFLPRPTRQYLWERFGDSLSKLDKPMMDYTKQKMLDDPDRYFESILRKNSRE